MSKRFSKAIASIMLTACLVACAKRDSNAVAEYSKEGYAMNCRAYVQVAIDSHRKREYTTDAIFNALERDCGLMGNLWGHNSQ
jgi:hypothetical protein